MFKSSTIKIDISTQLFMNVYVDMCISIIEYIKLVIILHNIVIIQTLIHIIIILLHLHNINLLHNTPVYKCKAGRLHAATYTGINHLVLIKIQVSTHFLLSHGLYILDICLLTVNVFSPQFNVFYNCELSPILNGWICRHMRFS